MILTKALLPLVPFCATLLGLAAAHPGEFHDPEEVASDILRRNIHAETVARGLEACLDHPEYITLQERAQKRRLTKALRLRQKRGLDLDEPFKFRRRDLAALEAFEKKKYNVTQGHDFTLATPAHELFALRKNSSCILTPEVTQGPYYISGEYIRSDVVEDQDGVPVHLEYQYIDISTCKAATGLYVETWQANATGVYSGVVETGNGAGTADPSNLNNTFLRGLQPVNSHGVAAFDTIFPGHYQGRATHIHLIARQDGTVNKKNHTYIGGTVSHVGQVFFPNALKKAVEATAPYNTNTQAITTNNEDMWAPDQADNDYDPFPDYVYLGSDVSDGLLMWIHVGIDLTASYTVTVEGEWTNDGGVVNTVSGFEGGGGGSATGSGSGSAPTGSMPSGSGGAPTGSMPSGGAPTGSGGAPASGSASAATSAATKSTTKTKTKTTTTA